MAMFMDSIRTPIVQRGLLRRAQPVPTPAPTGVVPPHDTLSRRDIPTLDALKDATCCRDTPTAASLLGFRELIVKPDPDTAAQARALHDGAGAHTCTDNRADIGTLGVPHHGADALSPLPAPLPSLTSAFSRRRAIFGAVVLAATPVAVLPAVAAAEIPDPDAHLVAHCDKLHGLVGKMDELCRAHRSEDCDALPGWGELEGRRSVVLYQITETPALTLAGLAEKAKVLRTRDVSEDYTWSDCIGQSIARDVLRMHGGVDV